MKRIKGLIVVLVLMLFATGGMAVAGTLDEVRAKGVLAAGVNPGVAGFAMPDEKGVWKGLDVDTAKAIAAAVFGDANKVKYIALTAVQRLPALQSKEVDVLCRNTTVTLTRETVNGLNFAHVNYYDGQGFLISKKKGVKSAKKLKGATVCVLPGTTTEMNAADYFRKNGMPWKPVVIESNTELNKAFFAGRCDVLTSDASQLAAIRSVAPNPDDYIILPEIISKEPLAPVVRHGDDQWYDIAQWTVFALFAGEEFDITSANVDSVKSSATAPEVMRLLGVEGELGLKLGLSNDWGYNIIKLVGNYEEVYNRNLGPDTPTYIPRGLNSLYTDGGLLYAPPVR